MARVSLGGSIRISNYGNVEILLWPTEKTPNWSYIQSEPLKKIIEDHWTFFKGTALRGQIHGRDVSIRLTRTGRKEMSFTTGDFITVKFLEDREKHGERDLMFLEIPFGSDGAVTTGPVHEERNEYTN